MTVSAGTEQASRLVQQDHPPNEHFDQNIWFRDDIERKFWSTVCATQGFYDADKAIVEMRFRQRYIEAVTLRFGSPAEVKLCAVCSGYEIHARRCPRIDPRRTGP